MQSIAFALGYLHLFMYVSPSLCHNNWNKMVTDTIEEVEQMGRDEEVVDDKTINEGAATSSHVTARISPPRKKIRLLAAYNTHIEADIDHNVSQSQSAAAVVLLYVANLKGFSVQARKFDKLRDIFKAIGRFCKLHKILAKIMCIPATSAPVERIFSHGGLCMRPHMRLGPTVLSQLVFSKCYKHLNNK